MPAIGRRGFLASAAGATLLVQGSNETQVAFPKPQNETGLQVRQSGSSLTLARGAESWTFDLRSGAIARIGREGDGKSIEIAGDAASPVRLWWSDRDGSNATEVAIARSAGRELSWQVWKTERELLLVLQWKNLLAEGQRTGVNLTQTYLLGSEDPSLRVETTLQNNGHRWITGVFLGLERLVLNPDPARERLLVGDVRGESYVDPRHSLKAGKMYVPIPAGRRTFSIPPTVPGGLIVSWMDFADENHGIGTGYADSQDMDLVGHVVGQAEGLDLGWRLFRLEGSRGFMWGYTGEEQIYGLAPGEQFVSDPWFLLLNTGDWHETARAYRSCYEKTLGEDFLDWERTSPAVKMNDIIINTFVAWGSPSKDKNKAYDYPNGYVVNRFEDLPGKIQSAIETLDVAPENVLVKILGTGPNWGIYKMPDLFPMNAEAGGQAAAVDMCRKLDSMGIAGMCFYAHPYFMHREAVNYVPQADTGWNYPHMDWHTSMGGIACLGSDEWFDLWREKIYPKFIEMGIDALYFDEGFGHQFICRRTDHSHGTSALALLTAQSRGASRLYRTWREMAGPRAYAACESGSDVQARLIDLWHFSDPTPVMRYTHPDKLIMAGVRKQAVTASIAHAFLVGCPLLIAPFPGPLGLEPDVLEGELLEGLKVFIKRRQEMRRKGAPGYPQAYRDTEGLVEIPAGLKVQVYSSRAGLTLTYFAERAVQGRLVIEGARLGHPGLGKIARDVRVPAKEMGFLVARVP
jgi:hypothetical protein